MQHFKLLILGLYYNFNTISILLLIIIIIIILYIVAWFQAAIFWDFKQRRMVASYRHFGTTYRPNLQGSFSWAAWPLKRGPIGCPETSARNYRSTLPKIPKERRSHYTLLFISKGTLTCMLHHLRPTCHIKTLCMSLNIVAPGGWPQVLVETCVVS
jgi:hypothetical protein